MQDLRAALECAICREAYVAPVTLPCQHTFCRCCLLSQAASEPSLQGGSPACATCRGEGLNIEQLLSANETFALRGLLVQLHGGEEAYAARVHENKQENASLAVKLWERLERRHRVAVPLPFNDPFHNYVPFAQLAVPVPRVEPWYKGVRFQCGGLVLLWAVVMGLILYAPLMEGSKVYLGCTATSIAAALVLLVWRAHVQ